MAVELTGQQTAFLLQKVSDGNLVKVIDIFFCDEIAFLGNKVQPLFYAVNTVFRITVRGVSFEDFADTFSGRINAFNGKGGIDFFFHCLFAIRTALRHQQHFCRSGFQLYQRFQIDTGISLEVRQGKRRINAVF